MRSPWRLTTLVLVVASVQLGHAHAAPDGYREAFHELYRVLGRSYPAFELKGIDWAAVGRELLPRVEQVEDDEDFGLLCMELVARLRDNHARLLDGTAKVPFPPLPMWDAGFVCLEDDQGAAIVYHLEPGSSAEQAGVKIGWRIDSVDGEPTADAVSRTMIEARRFIGFSSERALRYQAYRGFARRHEQGVKLTVVATDIDGHQHEVELTANSGQRYIPRRPVPIPGIPDSKTVSWTMLEGNIGYISVRRMREGLEDALDEAITALIETNGIIIDVRGNSGGGFDNQRAHVNFGAGPPRNEPHRPRYRGPIALLIDARCASAGEGWSSWFIATGRARVFGQTTTGTSARKREYTLPNGLYRVRFPVKLYTGALDRPIEHRGLEPDVPLMPAAADVAAGRDTVVEAARAYLTE